MLVGERSSRPVADRGQLLDRLARRLPLGRVLPDARCAAPSKSTLASDRSRLNRARSWAKRSLCAAVTATALLIMLVGRGPLDRGEDVQRHAVLGVHPGPEVALDERDPGVVPAARRPGPAWRSAGRVDLANDRWRCCGRSSAPTPRWGRGRRASSTTARLGPLLRVAAGAVAEAVDPALGQVPFGVGLHVDGDVLVHRRPQLGRLVVVVRAALELGKSSAPASESVNSIFGKLRVAVVMRVAVTLTVGTDGYGYGWTAGSGRRSW